MFKETLVVNDHPLKQVACSCGWSRLKRSRATLSKLLVWLVDSSPGPEYPGREW